MNEPSTTGVRDDRGHPLGVPTVEDARKAAGWQAFIAANHPAWTLLSPEQQEMVVRRIEWATAPAASPLQGSPTTPEGDAR